MSEELVEGLFRANTSLDNALGVCLREDGVGLLDRVRFNWHLRRMEPADRKDLEKFCTSVVVTAGVPLPVGATIVGGVLVGTWLEFWQLLLDNLPKILEFIMTILSIFFII